MPEGWVKFVQLSNFIHLRLLKLEPTFVYMFSVLQSYTSSSQTLSLGTLMLQTNIQKLMKIVLDKYFSFKVNKCTLYTLSQKFITTMEVENDSYINKI